MLENLGTSTDFYKASLPGTDAPTGQTLRGHKSLRPVGMLSPEMLHQFGRSLFGSKRWNRWLFITLWLCQNSYGTSPFFMGKSTINGHFQ